MIRDLGYVEPGSTLYIPFHTFDSNDPQASVTLTGLATTDIEIYKDGSTTQRASDSGYSLLDTDGIDFDTITGIHGLSISLADNTTAGFYAAGSQYWVVVSSVTVDAATVNFVLCTFRIGYTGAHLNTTIATLASQTSFTLTNGPAEDDAVNGSVVLIHDVASAVQKGYAVVLDYTGSTKTVTLLAGTTFTAAATDNIAFYPPVNASHAGSVAYSTTRGLAGTALPNAAADAAGGLPISDAGGLDLDTQRADVAAILVDTGTTLDGKINTIDDFLDTEVAAILADTNELQTDWANGGRLDLILDARASQTSVDTIDNLVDDLETRLGTPSDLGGGATIAANLSDIEAQTDDIGVAGAGLTALASAANLATLAAYVDTEVAAILADTNELQTDLVNGGRLDLLIDAIKAQTDLLPSDPADQSALAALIAAAESNIRGADSDTLKTISDQIDGLTTSAGPQVLADTTIATLATQTSFTLTAGSADNDAYNGAVAIITDQSTATQKAVATILDYVGSTKTVTLAADPAIFTMAVGDSIAILANISSAPTAAAVRAEIDANSTQLAAIVEDTAEIGVAGAGLTNINLPNQTMDIVGNITGNLSGSVGSVTGAVGSVTGNVGGNVTGSVGSVAAGGITAASIATDAIDADALSADAIAEINATVDTALADIRLDELLSADSDIDGAAPPTVGSVFHELMTKTTGSFTYDQTTDSLEAVRDRGDAAWITATGFSTHSAADVWAAGTRTLTGIDEDTTTLDLDATIRAAVGMASASLDTQIGTLATASALSTVSTNVSTAVTQTTAANIRTAVGLASADLDTQLGALPTATENADAVLSRGVSNVEDTADTTSLCTVVLAMLESSISGTTWTIRKTVGTAFVAKTLTTTATADSVTGVT